jgi:hypothetical protein
MIVFASSWLSSTTSGGLAAFGRTMNLCDDLNVDDSFCDHVHPYSLDMFDEGQVCAGKGFGCMFNKLKPGKYWKKEVVDGLLVQASDITSLLNQHGYVPSDRRAIDALDKKFVPSIGGTPPGTNWLDIETFGQSSTSGSAPKAKSGEIPIIGGLALPRLADDTVRKLSELDMAYNHLSHGANLVADKSASAYPWRNSAWCTIDGMLPLDIILSDPYFNNDADKLPGYYAVSYNSKNL